VTAASARIVAAVRVLEMGGAVSRHRYGGPEGLLRKITENLMLIYVRVISTKCMPILLCGLEAFSLYNYQLKSLDRFFMKLFRSSNMHVVSDCQEQFNFVLSVFNSPAMLRNTSATNS